MDLILHIGFGKCGSSALQAWLSHQHILESKTGKRYVFCSVTSKGDVIWGDKLRRRARFAPAKYVPSAPKIYQLPDIAKLADQLRTLQQQGLTPILSCEGWARRQRDFQQSEFFEQLNMPTQVIAYVRPHVEWVNSAWWQWFRWTGKFSSTDDFWTKAFRQALWTDCLDNWAKMPNVSKLVVRLLEGDIVADFYQILDVDPNTHRTGSYTRNAGISPSFIKLYDAVPMLRPKPTNSLFDMLVKNFGIQFSSSPWVITHELAAKIIAHTKQDNERLLTFLDSDSQRRMQSNPKWWQAAAYADKRVWQEEYLPLTTRDLTEILATTSRVPVRYLRSLFD